MEQSLAKNTTQRTPLKPILGQIKSWFPLEPLTADWVNNLLQQPELLQILLDKYGAPVNIHHPRPFIENYKSYEAVMEEYRLDHLVQFARKANKCRAFVKAAGKTGFGVDTASYKELRECLELGVDPSKIVLTAAIKTEKMLRLALRYRVLIILDNQDECELLQSLAKESGKRARVGFRVSGFEYKGQKLYSRFGFDIDNVYDFISTQLGYTGCCGMLDYEGLHFHLDGYSTEQRGLALHACLDLAERLLLRGFKTKFVDIGGGMLVNYLKNKKQWEGFDKALQAAVRGEREAITFNNHGLGYEMINGQLEGKKKVYPYFNETAKGNFLRAVLNCCKEKNISAADRLRKNNIQLRMEPGRSLLDQCGITLSRVVHRKRDYQGNLLVGLEMNMTQMHSSSADFLLDPFVIHLQQKNQPKQTDVFFTGAYCLERDVLLKRKIRLQQYPEIGDLVVFVNTAGYMMHFFESEAHLFDLANNLVCTSDGAEFGSDDFIPDALLA